MVFWGWGPLPGRPGPSPATANHTPVPGGSKPATGPQETGRPGRYHGGVGLFGNELFVGFDAASVSVAAVSRGPGRRRVSGFARSELTPGALLPSPAGPNVVRRDEVRAVLEEALGKLPASGRASLVLPDGIARLAFLAPPSGADPRDYLRFRLASSLPWPAADAIVDCLPVSRGRVVGAAVRRGTVTEYEHLATSCGLLVERVLLGPLVALGALLGRRRAPAIHAVLGDVALCLALVRDGGLAALRSRRRDRSEGEGERLLAEARRTAHLAGDTEVPLVVSGADAVRLRDSLGVQSAPGGLEPPAAWPAAAEAAWLGGALP